MRQPPEKLLVGLFIMSGVKDRPARIMAALASAPNASISSNLWYTLTSRAASSASPPAPPGAAAAAAAGPPSATTWALAAASLWGPAPAGIMSLRSLCSLASMSASSCSSSALSTSHASTASITAVSSPTTSCSTWSTWQLSGMPLISCVARARKRVVLPVPLRPTKPYLLPNASMRVASSIKSLPPLLTLKFSKCRSRQPPPPTLRTMVGTLPRAAISAWALCASNAARAAASSLATFFSILARSLSLMVGKLPKGV
mmetsp:Transcript_15050/g.32613  ORF Transcript_15050/g.32613 Transcript_15050/m.32613 type:complete len:258 (+) Transcript_15050:1478-2251(+)